MFVIPFPDISPELFSFDLFGIPIALRWYALGYIAGLVLGWYFMVRMVRNTRIWATPSMAPKQVEDLMTWIILGVVLGGRLGFVLFYKPGYYWANPVEIVKVWQGGMAFHGGFLGVVLAIVFFAWRNRLSVLSIADTVAVVSPIGIFLVRLANFIKPELWGRPTDVSWAVLFPAPDALTCPDTWVGACTRHPSQLYEAGMEGLILGVVLFFLVYARGWLRHPGRLTGLFLAGYGLSRFIIEYFRNPDAQFITELNPNGYVIHLFDTGLTMGQLLSTPMILAGILLIALAWNRNARA